MGSAGPGLIYKNLTNRGLDEKNSRIFFFFYFSMITYVVGGSH